MKTALVTGASRGIGRAIATRLGADGYTIIGTYAGNKKAADEVAALLDATLLQVDFGKQGSIAKLIETLGDTKIDVLVNNAGVFEYEDFNNFDMGLWRKVMQINLDAIVELTTSLRMQFPSGAAIVNISSLDAFVAAYDSMSYAASKAALISLTQSLAVNLAPQSVRVNGIAPGWIETDMNADCDISDSVGWTPMQRDGQTSEVASVVSFFCSDDASFVTGQTLVVDSGYGLVDPVINMDSDRLRADRDQENS